MKSKEYLMEIIAKEGFAPCETVYILLQGHVTAIDHQKMGHPYSFLDFTKMYIVGDFEVFSDYSEYFVSIVASEDCKMLKISASSYLRWVQHDDNALFLRLNNIIRTLTFERRLDHENLVMGCKERLISFLVKTYEKDNKVNYSNVKLDITQAELASKIGFNIRSVQRSIAALEKDDLISNENGKIVISPKQYAMLKKL